MAPKVSPPLFSFILVLLLPILFHAILAGADDASQVEYLKNLQGCQKGDKVKGIQELKKYLKHYGYLSDNKSKSKNKILDTYSEDEDEDDDDFDDVLESAIKTYQENYNLNSTGTLDAETVSNMMKPRCGVPDIINGTNSMKRHEHSSKSHLHTVSHYSLYEGRSKWNKKHFTYAFSPRIPREFLYELDLAFKVWDSVLTPYGFNFEMIGDYGNANLKVSFDRGDHGDGFPFTGQGGAIAHAFPPPDGRLHINADHRLSFGRPVKGSYDVETVALHEIGHLLGLEHSSVQDSVMYAYIPDGTRKLVHVDDFNGIKDLYGL